MNSNVSSMLDYGPIITKFILPRLRPTSGVFFTSYSFHLNSNLSAKRRCHQAAIEEDKNISSTKNFVKPNIPFRIHRGPTDILKALAKTVSRDTSGPEYKYHDDPYLTPISAATKRNYALSKESGRKAARFIRDSHGEVFNHQPDDPVIKKYLPKIKLDENNITEEDLKNSIQNFCVSESIDLFQICQSKNIDISVDTRQSLLELLSFYNCEDIPHEDWLEERKVPYQTIASMPIKTWKDNSIAEELFHSLKKNGSKPYCAIIRGMSTHNQYEKCWELYQEALNTNINLDSDTFNSVIRICPGVAAEQDERIKLIYGVLYKMADSKIKPNLGTMNCTLEALCMSKLDRNKKYVGLEVFVEFKALDIEPSLASYYWFLRAFYAMKHRKETTLVSILKHIENKRFTVQDVNDNRFFCLAMTVASQCSNSLEIVKMVHKLFLTGDNSKFIGEYSRESIYYQGYFTSCVRQMPLKEFMEMYDSIVPHIYVPDTRVFENIVQALNLNNDLTLLPKIWSDYVRLGHGVSEKFVELILMVIEGHDLEDVELDLKEDLKNIAWDTWEKLQSEGDKKIHKMEWTGQMAGDCIEILFRCDDVESAWTIFCKIVEKEKPIFGMVPLRTLGALASTIQMEEVTAKSRMLTQYAKDNDVWEDLEKNIAKENLQSNEAEKKSDPVPS